MLKWALFLCILLAFLSLLFSGGGSVKLGPGVKAPDDPVQKKISRGVPFSHGGCELTPLAGYSLRAKILSRRDYKRGVGSQLYPFDFALGWGNMSDESVLSDIEIR